ncbi:GerMN domain-containing protein [Virgibacillus xinjiangensis]|uniref:GerMN domain-containing protein n=1 Tax=Virgibacillus xinjiangensis TaxID=393090 RepID=A0ABV7CUS0_9BACI
MRKQHLLWTGLVVLTFILAGCFQGEQSMEEIDAPEDAEPVDSLEEIDTESDEGTASETEGDDSSTPVGEAETVPRQLYLLDANGMVASQTLNLPLEESKEVAAQALQHLVKGGPVTPMLPNGFQAVLPEGTEILSLNLQEDGTIIVDVSQEFENYKAEDERKILEAMTYTLTQFENVERMKLRMNGTPLETMPVNGTPLGDGYSKTNGINIAENDTVDLVDSKPVTMYYPARQGDDSYYVPVTQYVEGEQEEMYSNIIRELVDGPGYQTNATQVFNGQTGLADVPTLTDGVLELEFTQDILAQEGHPVIADEVMETIVRTMTELQDVEAVQIEVESVDQLVNESGEAYEEPVTSDMFIPAEKL